MNNVYKHFNRGMIKNTNGEKRIIHHNSRNILSILFDEVNLNEEKFDTVKKELNHKHHFRSMMNKLSSFEVFNKQT